MAEGLFSAMEVDTGASVAGFRLHHLEMFNWGTFDQRVWKLTPANQTTLLTGDIGSGKSTVVDAITTLLLPAHRIAYNKAAGADTKERTLRSYVEGHYKSEQVEASGRSRAIGLRTRSNTYSVLLGVFVNEGYGEQVTLAQVFQQRDQSGQPYRFFTTSDRVLSIATDFADFGSDLRDLRKRLRATGVSIFTEFPAYGASLRRLLGIRSEQALDLFHQTVSMKSVGNLNDFVRDHMLEPTDASDKVRDIVDHFEDLTTAHEAVKRAREQLEALEPLVAASEKYDAAAQSRADLERRREAVGLFVAESRSAMLAAEIADMRSHVEQEATRKAQNEAATTALGAERDELITERGRAGGDRIGELERRHATATAVAQGRRERRVRFDQALADAGRSAVHDDRGFADLMTVLAEERPKLEAVRRQLDDDSVTLRGELNQIDKEAKTLADELTSLTQRTSNLPATHAELRERLCHDLSLSIDALPYAGELLDVSEEHDDWRGAAERVLRGFALSLLVPQDQYDRVASWVNGRRLTFGGRGTKLVYERVPTQWVRTTPTKNERLQLADCLVIKDGPFAAYLRDELRRRASHLCVGSVAQFVRETRAVTREGQVRSGDRHEKDDRTPADNPRYWVLGWVNERKVAALTQELEGLQQSQAARMLKVEELKAERDQIQQRIVASTTLGAFTTWTDLDVEAATAEAARHAEEKQRLEAGSSRLAEITRALQVIEAKQHDLRAQHEEITGTLAKAEQAIVDAERTKGTDDTLVAEQPQSELDTARDHYESLQSSLGDDVPRHAWQWADAKQTLTESLTHEIESLGKQLSQLAQSLTQQMGAVLRRWPELRGDMDDTVEARSDFVALHAAVRDDDLPQFEDEFKRQLNTNTIRELAQFNSWLRRQAEEIDNRVSVINEALGAIPYNPGRYIRLEKQPTNNQDVAIFRTDLRAATDDALAADDDHYSERRFHDVEQIIERFRGRESYSDADRAWTRRVTDVRNWFVFSASERVEGTDEEWDHYADSDGKSGGQKEKLAYTILAASLAYQFGLEWGVTKSRDFRFAVIDEAFGRGSDASTRYALELFAKLGLQLLIVTPMQKVHVIDPYVKAIGFVDNPDGGCSRIHTMTIKDYRARRDGDDGHEGPS